MQGVALLKAMTISNNAMAHPLWGTRRVLVSGYRVAKCVPVTALSQYIAINLNVNIFNHTNLPSAAGPTITIGTKS